MKNKRSSKY